LVFGATVWFQNTFSEEEIPMKPWYEKLFENYARTYDKEGYTQGTLQGTLLCAVGVALDASNPGIQGYRYFQMHRGKIQPEGQAFFRSI